jgi:argininosuccinate lyase
MNKLWGARFKKKTHPLVEKFTSSISYDYKLAKYDVQLVLPMQGC